MGWMCARKTCLGRSSGPLNCGTYTGPSLGACAHPLLEALHPAPLGLLAQVRCISGIRLLFIVDKECPDRDDAGDYMGLCTVSNRDPTKLPGYNASTYKQ